MPFHFKKTEIMPYNNYQLFKMIMDIEKYSEFIPHCKEAKIITKSSKKNSLLAELTIKFLFLQGKYISEVDYSDNNQHNEKYSVNIREYQARTFKLLSANWSFHRIKDNLSEVSFTIDYEFNSQLHNKFAQIISTQIENLQNQILESFKKRAIELFGKPIMN